MRETSLHVTIGETKTTMDRRQRDVMRENVTGRRADNVGSGHMNGPRGDENRKATRKKRRKRRDTRTMTTMNKKIKKDKMMVTKERRSWRKR